VRWGPAGSWCPDAWKGLPAAGPGVGTGLPLHKPVGPRGPVPLALTHRTKSLPVLAEESWREADLLTDHGYGELCSQVPPSSAGSRGPTLAGTHPPAWAEQHDPPLQHPLKDHFQSIRDLLPFGRYTHTHPYLRSVSAATIPLCRNEFSKRKEKKESK